MGASMEDLARCPGIGERKVYYQWWNCDGIMICPYLFVVFVAWSWSPAHSDVLAKKIWIFCTLPDNRSSACLTLFMNPSSMWNPAGKPFQRLLSRTSQLVRPVSSIRNNAESSSLIEDKQEDTEDVSKRRKKEPEVTVKSALSAAFAKYSGRVGKRKSTSQVEEKEESIISKESEAET